MTVEALVFRSRVLHRGEAVRLRDWARVAAVMEAPAASRVPSAQ